MNCGSCFKQCTACAEKPKKVSVCKKAPKPAPKRHLYDVKTGYGGPATWEISETDRHLPGTPAAKLHKDLGHNVARRSGQQYADKLRGTGAYGSYT